MFLEELFDKIDHPGTKVHFKAKWKSMYVSGYMPQIIRVGRLEKETQVELFKMLTIMQIVIIYKNPSIADDYSLSSSNHVDSASLPQAKSWWNHKTDLVELFSSLGLGKYSDLFQQQEVSNVFIRQESGHGLLRKFSPIFPEFSTRFAQNDQPVIHRGVDDKLHNLFPA